MQDGALLGETADPLRAGLEERIGKPLGASVPMRAPDEVNLPMIRHWVDALDDCNPVYLDAALAARTRFGGIVAPPAMLQTWTMGRARIAGIAERGGAASEIDAESALGRLARAGYTGTLATNSELEFERYLRLGDRLHATTVFESVSDEKTTARGRGYFVTWVTTYHDEADEVVGRQRFRVFKFKPVDATGDTP
jgi:acyl dehydratase